MPFCRHPSRHVAPGHVDGFRDNKAWNGKPENPDLERRSLVCILSSYFLLTYYINFRENMLDFVFLNESNTFLRKRL